MNKINGDDAAKINGYLDILNGLMDDVLVLQGKIRKSVKERGLYMKIDGSSGLVKKKCGCSYAINLASGQLREFDSDVFVDRVLAEVNFQKK